MNLQSDEANAYSFTSVELKQTAFRIDGVFLPINADSRPIYFVEVQFQKDTEFYARLFSEIFLYLRLYAPTKPWRAVVIFPRRSVEPTEVEPYQILLESHLLTRLYLNELGDITDKSLGISIIKLVVENEKQTPRLARELIVRTRSELNNTELVKKVLDLIETVLLYKLPRISTQELRKMFGLDDFDIKKTRFYEEVREEVRQEQTLEVVMRLLLRRIGSVSPQLQERISQLSIEKLENLAEALLDFSTEADLVTWLQNHSS